MTVVDLVGDLGRPSCPALVSALAAVTEGSIGQRVIVDLTRLRFLAAAGAVVLSDARAEIERRRGCLQLVLGLASPARSMIAHTVRRQIGLRAHSTIAEARIAPAQQRIPQPAPARRPDPTARRTCRHGPARPR